MEVKDIKTVEDARAYFSADIFATEATGCVIEDARPGYARCVLTLEEKHRNAAHGVMGGAIYTLADFAFAVAATMTGQPTVSLNSQISFLSGVKGDSLIAEAVAVKSGRSTCYYRVSVTDNLGRNIAEMVTNGFIFS